MKQPQSPPSRTITNQKSPLQIVEGFLIKVLHVFRFSSTTYKITDRYRSSPSNITLFISHTKTKVNKKI